MKRQAKFKKKSKVNAYANDEKEGIFFSIIIFRFILFSYQVSMDYKNNVLCLSQDSKFLSPQNLKLKELQN